MSTYLPGEADSSGEGTDLAMIAASDALIDQIASRSVPAGDTLAADLAHWLDQFDEDYRPTSVPALQAVPDRALPRLPRTAAGRPLSPAVPISRPGRRRRTAAALAVASVVALAGTGVAAAAPGSFLYPLNSALFGHTQFDTSALDTASQALAGAAALMASRHHAGTISPTAAATAGTLLDRALNLLTAAPGSPRRTQLLERRRLLVVELAGLTVITSPVSGTDSRKGPTPPTVGQPSGGQGATGPTTAPSDGTVGATGSGDSSGTSGHSGDGSSPTSGGHGSSNNGSGDSSPGSGSGSGDSTPGPTSGSGDSPARKGSPSAQLTTS